MSANGRAVPKASLANQTTKVFVLTLDRADCASLEEMHAEASRRLPGILVEQVVSAVLTEAVRMWRDGKPVQKVEVVS